MLSNHHDNPGIMLARLLSNLPGFVYKCIFDKKWTMEFMSEGCKEITGYDSVEIIQNKNIPYVDIIHPKDRKKVLDSITKALDEQQQFDIEYRIINKQKEEIWVREKGVCYNDEQDRHSMIEGYITDINERKISEIQLEESRKLYKDLVELSPDGIIIFNGRGNIHSVNRKFCELSGYEEKDFIGKSIMKIPTRIRGKGLLYKNLIEDVISGKKSKNIYFHYKDKSDRVHLAEGRGKLLRLKKKI
jgi:PAS domain S-box-containing protein